MANKPSSKRYRVQISVELDASDRQSAFEKAQEIVKGNPNAKIKLQESLLGWVTVTGPDAPTS